MENDNYKYEEIHENSETGSKQVLQLKATKSIAIPGFLFKAIHVLKWIALMIWRPMAIILVTAFVLFFYFFYTLPWLQNLQPVLSSKPVCTLNDEPISEKDSQAFRQKVAKTKKNDQKILSTKIPRTPYLVINTIENKFYLRSGENTIRTGFCSTGSLILLKKSENEEWAFQTPRGIRTIRSKTKEPVWKKPDWAFVEEGLPIPSQNDPSRYDYATLGDYSLSLGNGYLIHGTLYQRLLGMPVTHGCIRLGDDDLEAVYKSLQLGAKVYIY